MEISSRGAVPSTIKDYLAKWTTNVLKPFYGQDYFIKPEGVIDNLATGSSGVATDFENVLLYLIKNMNPNTAEDEFQNYLYALIGLVRTQASYTIVQRTVAGTANTVVLAGSLIFENTVTKDQFKLLQNCTLDENGVGTGTFRAEEAGAIDLPTDAICRMLSAPTNVTGVYYSSGNNISIGIDYQSNAEFREEWLQEQSLASANTIGGIKKALLPYCNNKSNNIKVRMNRGVEVYDDVPLHSANIVVNSSYDDQTIANVIGDKILDGLGLAGDIEMTYVDSEGNEEDILFSRATDVDVVYQVEVVLKEGYIFSSALSDKIEAAIRDNTDTTMGTTIVANKAVKYIDAIDDIDYVSSIKVSDDDGTTWEDYIEISDIERAVIGDIDVDVPV